MTDFPSSKELVARWITFELGERCDEYSPHCLTCMTWKVFDETDLWPEPQRAADEPEARLDRDSAAKLRAKLDAFIEESDPEDFLDWCSLAQPPTDEYEAVGWQFKFPSPWGGYVWVDDHRPRNGSSYVDSRVIYAKRAPETKEAPPIEMLPMSDESKAKVREAISRLPAVETRACSMCAGTKRIPSTDHKGADCPLCTR